MQNTTVSLEKVTANLVARDYGETSPLRQIRDLRPIYHAMTVRPTEVSVLFGAPRHSAPVGQPTYHALTRRPVDFPGLFSPSRHENRDAVTYFAMKEHPAEAVQAADEAAHPYPPVAA